MFVYLSTIEMITIANRISPSVPTEHIFKKKNLIFQEKKNLIFINI